jgi:hypothetical protein
VDFIKVDAEGSEAAIVNSTDWRRLRPRVLLIEATRPWSSMLANHDWEPTLLEQGYVRAYFDGINCFYIPEEEVPTLLRHFQVPVNVLDRVERHVNDVAHAQLHVREAEAAGLVAERDTLRATLDAANFETARLTVERDELQAALDERRAELERLTISHEAELARLTASHEAELARLTISHEAELTRLKVSYDAELGRLKTSSDAERAQSIRLATERDALQAALHGHQVEVTRLALERDAARIALEAKVAEEVTPAEVPVAEPAPLPTAAPAPPRLRTRLARGTAKAVYRLVRPVVRPALWRIRGFMIGEVNERLGLLDQRVVGLAAAPPQKAPILVMPESQGDGAAAEMRRLAVEMERTLLTLALERAADPLRAASADQANNPPRKPPAEQAAPSPQSAFSFVPLLLPDGRVYELSIDEGQPDVFHQAVASGGANDTN